MKNEDILTIAKFGQIKSFSGETFEVLISGLLFEFSKNWTGNWAVRPRFESTISESGETPQKLIITSYVRCLLEFRKI